MKQELLVLQNQVDSLQIHISELEKDKEGNKKRLHPLYILLDNLKNEMSKLESKGV